MKKYKITANKSQLLGIGITYDIMGLVGELVHIFPDNYHVLKVEHKYSIITFTNEFDIPEGYLIEVIECERCGYMTDNVYYNTYHSCENCGLGDNVQDPNVVKV